MEGYVSHLYVTEDKEKIVQQYLTEGHQVMMVGDGINDAPSLARASIGSRSTGSSRGTGSRVRSSTGISTSTSNRGKPSGI